MSQNIKLEELDKDNLIDYHKADMSNINEINKVLGKDFIEAVNIFCRKRQVFEERARCSAPWKNLLKSNEKLLSWCKAVRDNKITKKLVSEIQGYLNNANPKLIIVATAKRHKRVKSCNLKIDYQLTLGNPNIKDFDKDYDFDPGLVRTLEFAQYLDQLTNGHRREVSDCRVCGKWFEWSGRGFNNKYCSERCKNRAFYIEKRRGQKLIVTKQ